MCVTELIYKAQCASGPKDISNLLLHYKPSRPPMEEQHYISAAPSILSSCTVCCNLSLTVPRDLILICNCIYTPLETEIPASLTICHSFMPHPETEGTVFGVRHQCDV